MQEGKFVVFEGIDGSGKTTQAKKLHDRLKREGVPVILNAEPTATTNFGIAIGAVLRKENVREALARVLEFDAFKIKLAAEQEILQPSGGDPARKAANRALVENFFKTIAAISKKLVARKRLTERERQTLFIADRRGDLEKNILPALQSGVWVVEDRYELSTLAYGSAARVDLKKLYALERAVLGQKFRVPDITFFIELKPEIAVKRLTTHGAEKSIYEKTAFLARVNEQYAKAVALTNAAALQGKLKKLNAVELIDGSRGEDAVFEEIKACLKKI